MTLTLMMMTISWRIIHSVTSLSPLSLRLILRGEWGLCRKYSNPCTYHLRAVRRCSCVTWQRWYWTKYDWKKWFLFNQDQEEFSPLSHLVLDLLELDTAQVTLKWIMNKVKRIFCLGRARKCRGGWYGEILGSTPGTYIISENPAKLILQNNVKSVSINFD